MSRVFSPWLFAAAGGLLLAAGLAVVLSSPMRATSRSSRHQSQISRRVARPQSGRAGGILPQPARPEFWDTARRVSQSNQSKCGCRKREAQPPRPECDRFDRNQLFRLAWNALGPIPLLNEIPTFGGVALGTALAGVTGRVTAIVTDPTRQLDACSLVPATAESGCARTRPPAFLPIFNLEPTLSVGALALDITTNPNPTLYVGSGEGNGSFRFFLRPGRIFIEQSRRQLDATRRQPLRARVDRFDRSRYHADAANNLRGGDLRLEREPGGRVVGRGRLQSERPVALGRRRRVVDFISRGNLWRLPVLHQRSMSG